MLVAGAIGCAALFWFSCMAPELRNEELLDAAQAGNVPEMRRLVDAGADVNYEVDGPGSGNADLVGAVGANQLGAAKFLLDHGAKELPGGNGDCGSLLQEAKSSEMKRLLVNTICSRAAGTRYAR